MITGDLFPHTFAVALQRPLAALTGTLHPDGFAEASGCQGVGIAGLLNALAASGHAAEALQLWHADGEAAAFVHNIGETVEIMRAEQIEITSRQASIWTLLGEVNQIERESR